MSSVQLWSALLPKYMHVRNSPFRFPYVRLVEGRFSTQTPLPGTQKRTYTDTLSRFDLERELVQHTRSILPNGSEWSVCATRVATHF